MNYKRRKENVRSTFWLDTVLKVLQHCMGMEREEKWKNVVNVTETEIRSRMSKKQKKSKVSLPTILKLRKI